MPRPPAYADATGLIGLARIRRLDLLTLLPAPIFVTARVWQEVTSDAEKPGVFALQSSRDAGILAVVEEGAIDAFPQLDSGESTVLSVAAAKGAAVLIAERRARAVIEADPKLRAAIAQVTGIIGLVALAKDRGRVSAVKPLLDDLIEQSFRISPALYEAVLRRTGEL